MQHQQADGSVRKRCIFSCYALIAHFHDRVSNAGQLVSIDGYMNIAMEQTEEYVEGQLKNSYGDAFIRGNNVLYISAIADSAG